MVLYAIAVPPLTWHPYKSGMKVTGFPPEKDATVGAHEFV